MPTIDEAEQALDAGRQRHASASQALTDARARVEDVERRIVAGDPVTPSELAEGKAGVEHAQLALTGAEAPLQGLHDAARRAEADAEAEELAATLRRLGGNVARALEGVAQAMAPFVDAVVEYDRLALEAHRTAGTRLTGFTDRYAHRAGQPDFVEGILLQSCHGERQLATVVAPALRTIDAPRELRDTFTMLAAGAPKLPGGDR